MITVDYIADENGYRETRKEEPGFVQIRALPPRVRTEVIEPAPVRPAPVRKVKPVIKKVVKQENDSDLVGRIISQLTPFIRNTVTTSLGSSDQGI